MIGCQSKTAHDAEERHLNDSFEQHRLYFKYIAKYTAKNIIPEERHLNDSFEQHRLGSKAANATAAVNKHKAGEFKHVMNNMKDMNTGDGNGTTDHASPA